MAVFSHDPRREATPAIRGYVYQVDRSIECWLEMDEKTELHLECGEDIDHVARAAVAGRTLEQVKYNSDSVVTLRSPNAVATVANFLKHRHDNPNISLRFRYLTNAPIGKENVKSIKTEGIVLWNQVRDSQSSTGNANTQGQNLQSIRKLMSRASRPTGFNKKSWQIFETFWANCKDEALLDLINGLEWINEAPSSASMQPTLCTLLVNRGYVTDKTSADELYNRLFVFVIKLLSTDGPKILTRQQLLQTLARPLDQSESRLLERLSMRLAAVEGAVADLRQSQIDQTVWRQHQESAVASLQARVSDLAGEAANTFFVSAVAMPSLGVPELPARFSQRRASVRLLLESLEDCVWLSLEGAVSCGKTHLAILTARNSRFSSSEAAKPQVLWLSLRDLASRDALGQIDAMVAAFVGAPPLYNRADWYEKFCRDLAPNALIVLDDLPQFDGFDALASKIAELSRAAQRTSLKLISTSHYTLPLEVAERLNGNLKRLQCPTLNDEEATEILIAYGAPPERFETSRAKLINLRLKGHPLLISAFARYLQKRDWRWGEEEIKELLSAEAEFASELNATTLRRLMSRVEAEEREMLYRLNTCGGAFSRNEVDLLASVPPTLARPGEKLAVLTGLWVQAENDTRWRVSPLIEVLGESELSIEVRGDCHRALAQDIIGRGRLDQFDTASLLHHLVRAEDWKQAGGVLAHALQTLWTQNYEKRPRNDAGLTLMWSEMPLPPQMDFALRLLIRSYHVGFAARWGEDLSFGSRDLMELMEQATPEEAWVMPGIFAVATDVLAESDFPLYCRVAGAALRCATDPLVLPNGEPLTMPDDHSLEVFLLVKAQCIRSAEDLRAWVEIFETIPLQSRVRAMDDELAPTACLEVANLLWRRESDKPETECDWPALNAVLQEASDRLFGAEMPLMGAAFARNLITIQGEHQRDYKSAKASAISALPRSNNEDAAFLIEESLGRAFLIGERFDEAAEWLEKASRRGGDHFTLQRVQALVCQSKAVAEKSQPDKKLAIDCARCAAELSESDDVPKHDQARVQAELGIACWFAQDQNGTLEAFGKAVQLLIENREDSDYWKDAFVLIGHALGYLTAHALHGQGPKATLDGEEYIAPSRTMFIGFHPRRAALYKPERDVFLEVQLSLFASEIGRDESSLRWALSALKAARERDQLLAVIGVAPRVISHWIENDRYEDALQLAREHILLMVGNHASRLVQEVPEPEDPLALHRVEMAQLDESERSNVELWIATSFLLPVAFRVATLAQASSATADRLGKQLERLCHEQFEETRHPFWREAAFIFERTYQSRPTFDYLMSYPIEGGSEAMDERLRLLCYLGATLQDAIPLKSALALHLAFLPELDEGFLRDDRTSYRRIVVPFFFSYWLRAFSQERHQFASHSLPPGATLEGGIARASALPSEDGLKQLFIVLSIALNTAGSDRAHEWLWKFAGSDTI